MNRSHGVLLIPAALAALARPASGAHSTVKIGDPVQTAAQYAEERNDPFTPLTLSWPAPQRAVARILRLQYGDPDKATKKRFLWRDKAPWKRIELEAKGRRFLKQTVEYRASSDRWKDLKRAPLDLSVSRRNEELTAAGDDESKNFLTLNIAHDVAAGRVRPEQARQAYSRMLSFADSGRSIPAMEELLFLPHEAQLLGITAERYQRAREAIAASVQDDPNRPDVPQSHGNESISAADTKED
ncbi:MAG: hypothetical protein HY078_09265 [Elusimicrobia bacterium]|nr:hypothetical protein [Elusimicrobiota bacterium]